MGMVISKKSTGDDKVLQFSPQAEWSQDEVREELEEILRSRFFIKSARLCRFLRTAVEYLLAGKAELFKEYTVGVEVYGRLPSYDPNVDSIVRTEARRLRAKLREYYANTPPRSSIMILLPVGSYVPVITLRRSSARNTDPIFPSSLRVFDGALHLAIFPFRTRSGGEFALRKACDLEGDLTWHLSQHTGIRLFGTSPGGEWDPFEQLRLWNSSGVQFVVHGKVRHFGNDVTADIQLLTLSGMILWTKSFDCRQPGNVNDDLRSSLLAAVFDSAERAAGEDFGKLALRRAF